MALVGFVGRQQLLGHFRQVIECDARFEIGGEIELRLHQFAGVEANQFAILLLIIRDRRVRQPFETGTEGALRPVGRRPGASPDRE